MSCFAVFLAYIQTCFESSSFKCFSNSFFVLFLKSHPQFAKGQETSLCSQLFSWARTYWPSEPSHSQSSCRHFTFKSEIIRSKFRVWKISSDFNSLRQIGLKRNQRFQKRKFDEIPSSRCLETLTQTRGAKDVTADSFVWFAQDVEAYGAFEAFNIVSEKLWIKAVQSSHAIHSKDTNYKQFEWTKIIIIDKLAQLLEIYFYTFWNFSS